MQKQKLGIVVPYRNRNQHLSEFLPAIKKYLNNSQIVYEIIVVEQADEKPFNRGKLLNIGTKKAIELGCNYLVLHDVDMLPVDVDYSYSTRPTHLAYNFISENTEKNIVFDEYFGGVTLFPISDFLKINGYSNEYWGWGYEDDDLLFRCKENLIELDTKYYPVKTRNSAGLYFNGKDSYIKCPKPFAFDKNYTIYASFEPDEIQCDSQYDFDEYVVFSVPGYDTVITYDSFKRYKFETWSKNKKLYTLKSSITPKLRTVIAITVDQYNRIIKMYQDGILVDETHIDEKDRLMPYYNQEFFYLGKTTTSEYNKKRPYKGVIDYFAIFNHSLEEGQIQEISNNKYLGLIESYGNYTTPHCLEVCYDMKISKKSKLIDLSTQQNDAIINNCKRVPIIDNESIQEVKIPSRRKCTFKLLPHPENGFFENKWLYTETRKNQIRFYNEVLGGKTNWRRDGYDTLEYKELSYTNMIDYHFISAEL
jgi:hypothetical protein